MIKKLVLCSLMLVIVAAFEIYDNRIYGMEPDGEEDYMGENYDYQDIGPYRPQIHADPVQSLILYQLFNSLQNRDDSRLHMPYGAMFSKMDNKQHGHVPFSEMMDFKGSVAKRRPSAPGSTIAAGTTSEQKDNPAITRQDTNSIAKSLRKKLPTWICYLKLCSIRFQARPTSSSG